MNNSQIAKAKTKYLVIAKENEKKTIYGSLKQVAEITDTSYNTLANHFSRQKVASYENPKYTIEKIEVLTAKRVKKPKKWKIFKMNRKQRETARIELKIEQTHKLFYKTRTVILNSRYECTTGDYLAIQAATNENHTLTAENTHRSQNKGIDTLIDEIVRMNIKEIENELNN